MTKRIFHAALVAGALMASSSSFAADAALLNMIDKAAARDGGEHLIATLMMAIETAPEDTSALVARALAAAPAKEKDILAAVAPVAPETPVPGGTTVAGRLDAIAAAEAAVPTPGFFNRSSWDGEVALGASYLSGNTEEKAISLGLKLDRAVGRWEHHFSILGDYSENTGVKTKERVLADYDSKWFAWERGYIFGLLDFELDTFSEFDWRLAEAVGAGYRVLDNGKMTWDIEGGPGARQTKFEADGTENEFIVVARSKVHWHIRDNIKFENVTSAFMGSDRTTLTNDAAFTAGFTERLSGRLSFYVKHDTSVPLGQEKTDTATRASLVYGF